MRGFENTTGQKHRHKYSSRSLCKKLTQDEVIAKLQLMEINISRSTYAKIETNRMNIRVSELIALAEILGVDYNFFFQDLTV